MRRYLVNKQTNIEMLDFILGNWLLFLNSFEQLLGAAEVAVETSNSVVGWDLRLAMYQWQLGFAKGTLTNHAKECMYVCM